MVAGILRWTAAALLAGGGVFLALRARSGEPRAETLLDAEIRFESEGPKSFDEPQRATEFFLEQRLAPGTDRLPLERLRAEREKLRRREAERAATPALATGGIGELDRARARGTSAAARARS